MTRRTLLMAVVVVVVLVTPLHAQRRRAVRHPELRELTAVEWLRANSYPLDTTEARSGLYDLQPLRDIVADARIVSLGEATHGSREFFTVKHRLLEFLVEEMGFTVFAIEANLPEADAVDDYVLRGIGNAADALRGMYFWTWDTEEVLDLIEWMRGYNLSRGDRPPVRFRGFDAQVPPGAAQGIRAYLERIAPEDLAILANYECVLAFELDPAGYSRQSQEVRDACAARLQEAHDAIAARRETYVGRSSEEEFEKILRYARVIVQAEGGWGRRMWRDNSMAENVEWLMNVAHPGEKAVLWAHNVHVANYENFMGATLRRRFGEQIVIAGFTFRQGQFNAYGPGGFGVQTVEALPEEGWEGFFGRAGKANYFIDLRDTERSPEAEALLNEERTTWALGSVWYPHLRDVEHRWPVAIGAAYDVLIYLDTVTASRLNPW